MKQKVISIIGNIVFVIFIVTILVSAVLFARNDSNDKSIFGFRYYTVLTPSMTPTIPVGSMVFVKLIDAEELKVGDVITYTASADGRIVVTHRINEILEGNNELKFITKGDANDTTDLNPVGSSQVIGRVSIFIPYLGSVMSYVQRNLGLVIISIVAFILILELISYLLSKHKTANKE